MKRFIQRYGDQIEWILSGFDRLVIRGTLRHLAYAEGLQKFLWFDKQVRLKDFGKHVEKTSQRLKEVSLRQAERGGRPVIYLSSSQTDKEAMARRIAAQDRIQKGLVCVLTCVEPCKSFEVHRDREAKRLDLMPRIRKCLFLYHYWMGPLFGFMNARIQTWYPFPIQICLNGREWLARSLDRLGLRYRREDNCFVEMEDPGRAQRLADRQLRICWPAVLRTIARRLNPAHRELLGDRIDYYWSAYQSEWATDIRFKEAASLEQIYRPLVLHGITSFGSGDVMRFLGRKPHGNFEGQIRSDFKHRAEGIRIKHSVNRNSVKMHNKHPLLLRVETTMNDASDFKVFRRTEGTPQGQRRWRPLRQGIADLYRRVQVSQKTNERYLDALAAADTTLPLGPLVQPLCRPVQFGGRRARGLRPWDPDDLHLFEAVTRGEFALNGFRNRDLQSLLFGPPASTPEERRRRGGQTSRRLRLLRAHGLIRKIPKSHRYLLTPKGREILTALLTAQRVTLEQLKKTAA